MKKCGSNFDKLASCETSREVYIEAGANVGDWLDMLECKECKRYAIHNVLYGVFCLTTYLSVHDSNF